MLRTLIQRGTSIATSRLCAQQGDAGLRTALSQQLVRAYRMSPFLPPASDMRPIRGERRATITLEMIGRTFLVHSGKEFKRVKIAAGMVGHKMGEFVLTRKIVRRQKSKPQRNK
jgi:ribosomal protein S19